jgi:Zn finger protein HypA/HybF involved in hydrogenase expression
MIPAIHGALYGEDGKRGQTLSFGYFNGANMEAASADMTCKTCRIPMKELKGHIYHKKRKWKCPKCRRVRMQQPRSR